MSEAYILSLPDCIMEAGFYTLAKYFSQTVAATPKFFLLRPKVVFNKITWLRINFFIFSGSVAVKFLISPSHLK